MRATFFRNAGKATSDSFESILASSSWCAGEFTVIYSVKANNQGGIDAISTRMSEQREGLGAVFHPCLDAAGRC
jgi:hypothetical protein